MPQMAPISWCLLFLMFTFIFILFNMMNYYCFYYKNSPKNKTNKIFNTKLMNWKW